MPLSDRPVLQGGLMLQPTSATAGTSCVRVGATFEARSVAPRSGGGRLGLRAVSKGRALEVTLWMGVEASQTAAGWADPEPQHLCEGA
ncbi:hypothetical protein Trco_006392 [Trichoderma cornu-damae]|uniref:Uncharacterized protein n=1 Tax=Trichoderma cornu-damae TaxID=654480 RepID=A0A9P8QF53_9HYPO|nr:hypothetical protein Trco_006392 [Trichoderma cornu-damae]